MGRKVNDVMNAVLRVTMPDGSLWDVPVAVIARHRAENYADEFGGDVERSLAEDTIPLFADDYEIRDWAGNNMYWSDVAEHAERAPVEPEPYDPEEGWLSGDAVVLEPAPAEVPATVEEG